MLSLIMKKIISLDHHSNFEDDKEAAFSSNEEDLEMKHPFKKLPNKN